MKTNEREEDSQRRRALFIYPLLFLPPCACLSLLLCEVLAAKIQGECCHLLVCRGTGLVNKKLKTFENLCSSYTGRSVIYFFLNRLCRLKLYLAHIINMLGFIVSVRFRTPLYAFSVKHFTFESFIKNWFSGKNSLCLNGFLAFKWSLCYWVTAQIFLDTQFSL